MGAIPSRYRTCEAIERRFDVGRGQSCKRFEKRWAALVDRTIVRVR